MVPVAKKILSAVGVFLAVWLGAKYLLPLMFPFLLGGLLALTAEPLTKLLCRRLRLPRPAAAAVSVTAACGCLAMLVLLLCALILRELGLLAGVIPDLGDTARSGLSLLEEWLLKLAGHTPKSIQPILNQNITDFFSGGTALLDRVVRYVLGLAGTVLTHVPDSALTLGTALISGYMIAAKLPKLRRWTANRLPREKLQPLLDALKRIRKVVAGWLLAQLKLTGVTWGILTVGFLILQISYGPLWALAVSAVDAFPVLGTGTVLIPWSIVCLLQGNRVRAIGLLGVYAVVTLTRSALEPRLVGRQLGLDPLVTLMALYAGYKVWGIGGMILAPVLAVTALQLTEKRE